MDNNPIVRFLRFLIEVSTGAVHLWLIFGVYNYINHGLDPTFESLGQIVINIIIGSILLDYLTRLNL